jgi:small ligand-binding sensory domain FIST
MAESSLPGGQAGLAPFAHAHATHPDWRLGTELVLAQLDAPQTTEPLAPRPGLGLLYVTPAYAPHLVGIEALLRERTGIELWAGGVGQGVCAGVAEYRDEPALAVLILDLSPQDFRLFSGRSRLPEPGALLSAGHQAIHTALVHADPGVNALPDVLQDLARRVETGYLFGGVVHPDGEDAVSHLSGSPLAGGLSGVAFSSDVRLLSRVTQGCRPLAREHRVTRCRSHFIETLDDRPALDVLLEDLGVDPEVRNSRDGEELLRALPRERLREGLLVGFAPRNVDHGRGFGDYQVRNLMGIDPGNRILAVGANPEVGDRAVFCTRDAKAARSDLIRICAELRDEVESEGLSIRGALYFSCVARGQHLFGGQGVELEIIRHNLGEVPLVGLFANGEIARDRLYGFTGVLTLFVGA